ncbi:MAG: hypothetical protein KA714_26105 [Limnoraphis sp. WC205]|nr:hypothetical protein [Limnoraphis sp. WC205]
MKHSQLLGHPNMKASHFKMIFKSVLTLSFALMILLLHPAKAYACACCAYAGQWFNTTQNLDSSVLERLNGLKFDQTANLYTTAAGLEETIIGITSPSESYTLSHSKNKRSWNFRFINQQGKTVGNLSFSLPQTFLSFGTDLYDKPTPDNRLYKEERLSGRITGSGIFTPGMTSDTQYTFITQGKDNNSCSSPSEHWILKVSGSKARYSFYGKFRQ